jgi:hypothetical protein
MGTCSVCGAMLEGAQVLYTPDGEIVCQRCSTAGEVRAARARSAAAARNVAYGNIAVGVVSFFFNPLFALSIGAVGNAVYVFRRIRSDRARRELAGDEAAREVAAVIGASLGIAAAILRFV